jgi:hypothetical protein
LVYIHQIMVTHDCHFHLDRLNTHFFFSIIHLIIRGHLLYTKKSIYVIELTIIKCIDNLVRHFARDVFLLSNYIQLRCSFPPYRINPSKDQFTWIIWLKPKSVLYDFKANRKKISWPWRQYFIFLWQVI